MAAEKKKSGPKWVQKFYIPSQRGGTYTVALANDLKTWGCSCPDWISRHSRYTNYECKHIQAVKAGGGIGFQKPAYITSTKISLPEFHSDANELLVPPRSGNDDVELTVCFHMMMYGYTIREVRSIREVPGNWTAKWIKEQVKSKGQVEYNAIVDKIVESRMSSFSDSTVPQLEETVRKLLIK